MAFLPTFSAAPRFRKIVLAERIANAILITPSLMVNTWLIES
jgi:hypothetical protein